MTTLYLKRIAGVLELPTSGSADQLRQIVDAKLDEMHKEPQNVQVIVYSGDEGAPVRLELQDEDGTFLEVPPEEPHGPLLEGDEEKSDSEGLAKALRDITAENTALKAEVSMLHEQLGRAKEKIKSMWKLNCEQLMEHEALIEAKDDEIANLKARLTILEGRSSSPDTGHGRSTPSGGVSVVPGRMRRGKAPPIDCFTGESMEILLDDWLPALERARDWNGWTEAELLMQMAGHLKGRALQEFSLLDPAEKDTYTHAVSALRARLDPGSKALAAQEFRHTTQRESESVADFTRRLERTFKIAYGRDVLSADTRDTLLHGQLQDGLKYELMKAPAVSGAETYKTLCMAARNEEKRLVELKKRQQYQKVAPSKPSLPTQRPVTTLLQESPARNFRQIHCWKCRKQGHLARDCPDVKTESKGNSSWRKQKPVAAKQIHSTTSYSEVRP